MTVVIDGGSLSLDGVRAVAIDGERVELSAEARARMATAREVVRELLEAGAPVYGLTTGLAERKLVELTGASRRGFSEATVRSHRVAQGPPASPAVVRAAMLCLLNSYAKGAAGVRPVLADSIVEALNIGFIPNVRTLGSVGQADLGPMADLASSLLDRGGLELEENEGVALLNNNAFSTGSATLAVVEAEQLLASADVAAALDLEAFGANLSPLHPIVGELRPFPGLKSSIERLRRILEGSSAWGTGWARNLQDPLTFRCIAQIHGAARDALAYARRIVETEVNSAQGNPAISIEERRAISVGNFDVVAVAAALDFARIALAPVLTSATERTVKLLQAPVSGLPPGLAASPDTGEDALAEFAVASQSLTAEARTLAHPVSFELVSSMKAEGIEDRMTMAPLSARRLAETVALGQRVLAVELTVASQALDLRPLDQMGEGTQRARAIVRRHVPPAGAGELPPHDLEPLVDSVRLGEIARCR